MEGQKIAAVILAAGKGTRMCSPLAKVLHSVAGISMIAHVIKNAQLAGIEEIIVIVGHQHEQVCEEARRCHPNVHFAYQMEQLGTGHAVIQAIDVLNDIGAERIVILSGDVPLLHSNTIRSVLTAMVEENAKGVVLSAIVDQPYGMGRILRESNVMTKIVEEKDCTLFEKNIFEINSGVYAFDWLSLKSVLAKIESNNAQHEYYLTDAIRLLLEKGDHVICKRLDTQDNDQIIGVNDKKQLDHVETIYKSLV